MVLWRDYYICTRDLDRCFGIQTFAMLAIWQWRNRNETNPICCCEYLQVPVSIRMHRSQYSTCQHQEIWDRPIILQSLHHMGGAPNIANYFSYHTNSPSSPWSLVPRFSKLVALLGRWWRLHTWSFHDGKRMNRAGRLVHTPALAQPKAVTKSAQRSLLHPV